VETDNTDIISSSFTGFEVSTLAELARASAECADIRTLCTWLAGMLSTSKIPPQVSERTIRAALTLSTFPAGSLSQGCDPAADFRNRQRPAKCGCHCQFVVSPLPRVMRFREVDCHHSSCTQPNRRIAGVEYVVTYLKDGNSPLRTSRSSIQRGLSTQLTLHNWPD